MPVSVLILPGIVVTQCSVGQILKGNECVCDTAAGYRNGAINCVCENDYVNDRRVCFHPVNGTTVDYDREVRTIDVVGQNRSFSARAAGFGFDFAEDKQVSARGGFKRPVYYLSIMYQVLVHIPIFLIQMSQNFEDY